MMKTIYSDIQQQCIQALLSLSVILIGRYNFIVEGSRLTM